MNFIIGKSDYHKDWNLMQVPRAKDDTGRGEGDATTWRVWRANRVAAITAR